MANRQDRKNRRQNRNKPDYMNDQLGENKYEAFEDYEEFYDIDNKNDSYEY